MKAQHKGSGKGDFSPCKRFFLGLSASRPPETENGLIRADFALFGSCLDSFPFDFSINVTLDEKKERK